MSNDKATTDSQPQPAVAGQLDRPVRPGAEALLPCPCGAPCVADEDSLYPANRARTLWQLHCVDPACGWYVYGLSADECIRGWKRRAASNEAYERGCMDSAAIARKWGDSHGPTVSVNAMNAGSKIARAIEALKER